MMDLGAEEKESITEAKFSLEEMDQVQDQGAAYPETVQSGDGNNHEE